MSHLQCVCPIRWLAVVVLLGHAQVPEAASRGITPADVVEAEVVGGPTLSDSGSWVAYTVSQSLIGENKRDTGVYLVAADDGTPRRLLGEGARAFAPQWIPGRDVLTFLAPDDQGGVEVFSYTPATDQISQVTDLNRPIGSFRWSPGSTRLALVLSDQPEVDLRWEGLQAPWVIDRQQFKADGIGYLDRTRRHIHVLDVAGGGLRQLTHGEYDNGSPVWSPDGRQIAFASNRTDNPDANGDIDIWVMPVDEGDSKRTLVSRSDDMDWSPVWSPDGRYLAYSTYEQPEYFYYSLRKIEVYDFESGATTMVAEGLDRSISSAAFSPGSGRLYFVLESEGSFNLAYVDDSGSGEVTFVTAGENSIIRYALSTDGRIAVRNAGYRTPGNYIHSGNLYMLDDGRLRQITHHNEPQFADIELVDGIAIRYPARDGHQVQAWVYRPADFDPAVEYPLVIDLHGGSVMQVGYRFEGMAQLLAANGYVVLVPNYRGSSGYGREHQLANWQRFYNGSDFEDVVDGARYMAALPYIDGKRMAVQGWSYGGGLTTRLITAAPDLFAAAISGAGNSYRYGEYGTDIYQAALEKVIGLPWENRALWQQGSSFDDVANAVTPTMFVSGEKDWNVPVSNSERMYQAMKRLGLETLLVVYPGQPHGIQMPRYAEHRLEMYLQWYRKYLK